MITFNELSAKLQAKAIEITLERENSVCDNFFAEYPIEQLKEEYNYFGVEIDKVYWDVSYCQGSGASFTSEYISDLEKVLRHFKIWSKYRMLHKHIRVGSINTKLVSTCHRYNHYNTVDLECELDYYTEYTAKQEAKCEELQEELLELFRERMRKLHRDLEKEYGYTQTEEYIKDLILDNEWEFVVSEDNAIDFA